MLSSNLHGCQRHWLDHGLAVKNIPNTRSSRLKLPGMLWRGLGHANAKYDCSSYGSSEPNSVLKRRKPLPWWHSSFKMLAMTSVCSSDFGPALCKMTTWWHHVALIWATIDLLCNQYQLRKNKKGTMQLSTQDGKVKKLGAWIASHFHSIPMHFLWVCFFMFHSLMFISFPFMSAVSKNDW